MAKAPTAPKADVPPKADAPPVDNPQPTAPVPAPDIVSAVRDNVIAIKSKQAADRCEALATYRNAIEASVSGKPLTAATIAAITTAMETLSFSVDDFEAHVKLHRELNALKVQFDQCPQMIEDGNAALKKAENARIQKEAKTVEEREERARYVNLNQRASDTTAAYETLCKKIGLIFGTWQPRVTQQPKPFTRDDYHGVYGVPADKPGTRTVGGKTYIDTGVVV